MFIIYIAFSSIFDKMYYSHKAQIPSLKVDETLVPVFLEYADFADILTPE